MFNTACWAHLITSLCFRKCSHCSCRTNLRAAEERDAMMVQNPPHKSVSIKCLLDLWLFHFFFEYSFFFLQEFNLFASKKIHFDIWVGLAFCVCTFKGFSTTGWQQPRPEKHNSRFDDEPKAAQSFSHLNRNCFRHFHPTGNRIHNIHSKEHLWVSETKTTDVLVRFYFWCGLCEPVSAAFWWKQDKV